MLPHLDGVFRLTMWLVRDRTEAEDVVQETFSQRDQGTTVTARDLDGPQPLAVAASLALVGLLGWQLASTNTSSLRTLVAHAVGDHRNCALEHSLEEPPISLDDAARQYDSRYAALRETVAQAPPVRRGEVEVIAAHWCVFEGTHFAHVVVRRGNHVASILLAPMSASRDVQGNDGAACPPAEGVWCGVFRDPGARGLCSVRPERRATSRSRAGSPPVCVPFSRPDERA